MIRFAPLLFAGLFTVTAASSQVVVNSTGSTLQGNAVSIEYSIGELAITTLNANQNHVTQGLLQPLRLFKDCRMLAFIPSAFTPNGDSKNDCFGVANWPSTTAFALSVYNRWGQLVFQTTKPADCWNGEFKGVAQPTGVYVYVVKATTALCGTVTHKGTITLIR